MMHPRHSPLWQVVPYVDDTAEQVVSDIEPDTGLYKYIASSFCRDEMYTSRIGMLPPW